MVPWLWLWLLVVPVALAFLSLIQVLGAKTKRT